MHASVATRPSAMTYAGVFMVTLSSLAYEITLTRIFSVTMWYHFAFVAISLALFGVTAGALIVHFRPHWFTEDKVKRQMHRFSLVYAVSIAVALAAQLAMPFRVELNAVAVFSVLYTCVVIAVPFTLSGVVVCLALTKFPARVNRLYAVDLLGAGVGCLLLVVGFRFFDGPSLVIFIAALAAVGAGLLALDAKVYFGGVLAAATAVVLVAMAVANSDGTLIRIIYGKEGDRIAYGPDGLNDRPMYEVWNAFSRVTVDGDPDVLGRPWGNGLSTEMPEEYQARQLGMLIDDTAGTSVIGWDGDPESTRFLRYDVTNLHYHALEGREFDAAVVGVGGGRDVVSALQFGAGDVVGIEINGELLDLVNDELGDFSGHLDQDPRVRFVVDEARSWLTRTDQNFDSIQISLIDSWAATAAGAFALTENTLYTQEAWDTFLDKLEPGGILSVSRFHRHPESDDPLEIARTTALAAEVLRQRGVENPRDHILIYEGPPGQFGQTVATVMVSPEPFDDGVVYDMGVTAGEMGFTPVLTPTESPDPRFANLVQPDGFNGALNAFPGEISPPTDDKPFFFQMASWQDVLKGNTFGAKSHMQIGVNSLVFLGLGVLLLAVVCIGLPLLRMARETSHRGQGPHYLYFCGIGLGFLLVEISQLMRLSTFLGHPTYALTVVLFTVLVFSGVGSMVVEKVIDISKPRSLLRPLVALLGAVIVFGLLTPTIIDSYSGATTPVRILVSVAILAPLSLCMGMPFATGMKVASADGAPTAFLWGINGATSVVASVFAMVIALFFGIGMTLVAGIASYGLAAASMFLLIRRLEQVPGDDPEVVEVAPAKSTEPVTASVASAAAIE